MNLKATRIDNENVVIKWNSPSPHRYNIYVDGKLVRTNTTSTSHSIHMGYQSIIKVENIDNSTSESLSIEKDKQMVYKKLKDGIIDISAMSETVTNGFKEFIVENGESGDLLKVNVELSKQVLNTEARLIKSGDTLHSNSNDKNIYLPFGFSENNQWVNIKSGDKTETLTYDNMNQSLVVGDQKYGFDEST